MKAGYTWLCRFKIPIIGVVGSLPIEHMGEQVSTSSYTNDVNNIESGLYGFNNYGFLNN